MKNNWELKFDSTLNLHYYENTLDHLIQFDLPFEVRRHRKIANVFKKSLSGVLSKWRRTMSRTMSRSSSTKLSVLLELLNEPAQIMDSAEAPVQPVSSALLVNSFVSYLNEGMLTIRCEASDDEFSIDSEDDVQVYDPKSAEVYYSRKMSCEERIDLRRLLWQEIN